MKRLKRFIFNLLLLLCAVSCGGFKSHSNAKIMDEILKTDLSHRLFMPDTILVEPDFNPETEDFFSTKSLSNRAGSSRLASVVATAGVSTFTMILSVM